MPVSHMIREIPPHYWGLKHYPPKWWRQQEPHFFPRWKPEWDYPIEAKDPWFDHGGLAESLFVDAVLPEQFFPTPSRPARVCEIKLLEAIIDNATEDIERYYLGKARYKSMYKARDAWEWIFSNDRDWTFSFLNCCFYTGIDATQVRRDMQEILSASRPETTPEQEVLHLTREIRRYRQEGFDKMMHTRQAQEDEKRQSPVREDETPEFWQQVAARKREMLMQAYLLEPLDILDYSKV